MNINRILAIIIIIIVIISIIYYVQLDINDLEEKPKFHTYTYSFENDMQGWNKSGIDLINPPINWSVNRTQTMAYNGSYSIRLYLENLNDAGKIWMERIFLVKPNTDYQVNINYYFGTADYGDINLFNLITGVASSNPKQFNDLMFMGDTGHHQETQDLVWLYKQGSFNVKSSSDGKIVVFIGVWGTWETTRIYFIDDLTVSILEK
jgi:hypothetical protein